MDAGDILEPVHEPHIAEEDFLHDADADADAEEDEEQQPADRDAIQHLDTNDEEEDAESQELEDSPEPQPVLSEEEVLYQTQLHTARKNCATKANTHHFVAPPTEPCVDISARDCRDPAALEAICSDCELAQYCRKSCGLCQGTTTWSENLVLFDFHPAHNHCNFSQAIGPSICHSIKAHGQVKRNADYLNLPTHDSFYQVNFTTNGEPLTNVQLLSCRTTGKGRVDIILNNVTIVEAYNETSIWSWDWILHELNPAQDKGTHNYTLTIVKDRKIKNYGYYWLRNIRLETTVVHHGHRK
uniref:Uncharacterized protein n=1 Tax=Magallana gigas TaxID=29159 RepID=A0A8W8NI22_MAGGI